MPCGQVDDGLLTSDDAAPFGVRLDQAAVVEAFERCSTTGLGGAGGGLRPPPGQLAFQAHATDALAAQACEERSASTDALVGELLEDLDPERDAVVVVAPTTEPDRRPRRARHPRRRAPARAS